MGKRFGSVKYESRMIGICIIFALSLVVNLYFGFQKSGFHEDEYYTYYSSNRTFGLYQPDREWQERQTILDEYVVKPGEGFNYGLVKLVQSWDVHPPLYYYIFHTICSLVPGVFTKWTGIATNLIAFAISFFLLFLILERLKVNSYLEACILLFWAVNPQTVSCNMLTRMYAWLTVFIFACALLHIRLVQGDGGCGPFSSGKKALSTSKKSLINNILGGNPENISLWNYWVKFVLPIMAVSFLGFLTQYFYLFFFVSIGAAYVFWLIFVKGDAKRVSLYILSCAVSLMLAVLYYPASVHHLFGGYRGNEAAGSLFDLGNTVLRISFFTGLLNDFVFAGGLVFIVLAIIVGVILSTRASDKKKNVTSRPRPEIIILAIGALGYFLLTSKAALLVGSASNRYEMPIYGLIIALILMDLEYVYRKVDNTVIKCVVAVFLSVLLVKGLAIDNRVLFMYPDDKARVSYASENRDDVAVVMYNPATPHNVWRLTDELLQYPKVYYMNEENYEPISDEEILNAGKIVLYIADDDFQKFAMDNLEKSTGLDSYERIATKEMWNTFELK